MHVATNRQLCNIRRRFGRCLGAGSGGTLLIFASVPLTQRLFSCSLCRSRVHVRTRAAQKKEQPDAGRSRRHPRQLPAPCAPLNSPRHGLHRRYWHARHRSQRSAMIDDDDRDDRAIVVRRLGRFHFSERLGRFSVSRARNGRDDRRKASVVRSS